MTNNFLPAKEELHRRHIEPIPNCDVCGSEKESVRHVLMECTIARVLELHKGLSGCQASIVTPSHLGSRSDWP